MTFAGTSRKKQPNAPVRLTPSEPATLQWQMQQLQLAIARRAYELFSLRGGEHGHDWEDWFRAESEILRPVSVAFSELDGRTSVRVNVLGFNPDELTVAVEPRRIMILGQKHINLTESERAAEYVRSFPDQIMRVLDLPTEIDPADVIIELQEGLLKFELMKKDQQPTKIA
jgi:HSP20 family protein